MTQTKAELLETKHQGDIRLGDANSSHYVGFKAPATVSTSLVWTLPAADGTANYLLKTDGSGNLSWTADNSGVSLSGSTNNTIATVTGANALQGEANLKFDGNKLDIDSATQNVLQLNSTHSDGPNVPFQRSGTGFGNVGSAAAITGGTATDFAVGATANLVFGSNGSNERARIDSSGRLVVGHTSSYEVYTTSKVQVLATDGSAGISISRWSNNSSSGYLNIGKSRGAIGTATIVQDDDRLGQINFVGADGNDLVTAAASIAAFVDGTPGSNDMPGRLVFSTTADGAASETARLTIDSKGDLMLGAVGQYNDITGHGGGLLIGPGTGSDSGIMLRSSSSGVGRIYFGDNSGSDNGRKDGFIVYSQSSRTLSLGTAQHERYLIGSAGQFGIAGANYGSSGQVLTSGGGSAAPTWADAAGGGATPTVKTANYTAASGDLVVVNGSGLTITLPSSPSVADFVEIRILGSRYCTVARNGSNIESTASNFYMDTFDGHTKFIYTDSTRGWLVA